jgi:hypothetical protein
LANFINTVCDVDQDPLEYAQILDKKRKEVNEHYAASASDTKTPLTTMKPDETTTTVEKGDPKSVPGSVVYVTRTVVIEREAKGGIGGGQGVSDAMLRDLFVRGLPDRYTTLIEATVQHDTTYVDVLATVRNSWTNEKQREATAAFSMKMGRTPTKVQNLTTPKSTKRTPAPASTAKDQADSYPNHEKWTPGTFRDAKTGRLKFQVGKNQCFKCFSNDGHWAGKCPLANNADAQVKLKCGALAAVGIIVPANKVEALIADIVVSSAAQDPTLDLGFTYPVASGAYHTTTPALSPHSHVAPYEYSSLGDSEGEYEDEVPATIHLADSTVVAYETSTRPTSFANPHLDSGATRHFWRRREDLDEYRTLATPIVITGAFNSTGYAIGEGTLHEAVTSSSSLTRCGGSSGCR